MNTLIEHTIRFVRFRFLIFSLCALCVLCGELTAQEWKTLKDGIEYADVRREFSGKAVNINLLRLDLKKVRLDVHHALDAAIGTEKTSSIATRHGAFAAINAGFFRLDKSAFAGDPVGVFVVDGKVLSEPREPRIAMVVYNSRRECSHCPIIHETSVSFETLNVQAAIYLGKNEIQMPISGLNRERKTYETVLYTRDFGERSPLSETPILEVSLDGRKVTKVATTRGGTVIPKEGSILILETDHEPKVLKAIAQSPIAYSTIKPYVDETEPSDTNAMIPYRWPDHAVGGVPQLIKDSKIDITWEQEKTTKAFVETRHPRTAVAKLKDGKFLMMTADGRTEQSAGLDLYDLAAYLLELGATDAMNLDGGGSTTMFLDGKVVNQPSDKEGERKVSDAILVTLRKPTPKNNKRN